MGMSFELMVLAAASLWGFLQLVAAAQAANAQHGLKWAASPRDVEMPPLKPIPARINRNSRNYMETFPFDCLYRWAHRLHRALYIRNTAHPLALLERRHHWHARGSDGAFRASLKRVEASR